MSDVSGAQVDEFDVFGDADVAVAAERLENALRAAFGARGKAFKTLVIIGQAEGFTGMVVGGCACAACREEVLAMVEGFDWSDEHQARVLN